MLSRQIQTLIQRSKTTADLLQLHPLLLKTALHHDEYIFSRFILSSSSISIQFARESFDNSPLNYPPLFACNTLIREYSKSSIPIESVKLFVNLCRNGLKADKFTYPFVIRACGRCSMMEVGGSVHSMFLKVGFDSDSHICNTLLMMYGSCGAIGFAKLVVDEMRERDVVSWSSMIAAYVHCESPCKALLVFRDMKQVNEKPNSITLVSLIAACTRLLNIRLGASVHSHILMNGIGLHVGLGTALLEMYSKCGHIKQAFHIFDSISEKNLQSWTVMISAFADHGHGEEAISLFSRMEEAGLRPDSVSFSAILSACSHRGLVNEAQELFNRMVNIHNIQPTMEHYGCMVDMFGRIGKTEDAYLVIRSMPVEPNAAILRSFISACKHYGRVNYVDEEMRQLLLKVDPGLGANYVIAASTSSLSGYWDDADDLRVAMKEKGLRKVPGCSWLQMNGAYS